MGHRSRAVLLSLVVLASGCATTAARAPSVGPAAPAPRVEAAAPALVDVPTPERFADAEAALEQGYHALERGDDAQALVSLRAVLRSEFLTPEGRAHVYWASAGAARRTGDRALERSLLEGFLLVTETLDEEPMAGGETFALQASLARGVLLARKIEENGLGRASTSAIVVEDQRDTRTAIAALGCGEDGSDALVPVAEAIVETEDVRLLRRSVACADGAPFDLWFDVSSLDDAAPMAAARLRRRASPNER